MKKRLFVFDFDDTLVKSKSKVIVHKSDGRVVRLSPLQYVTYKINPNDKYDFSEFTSILKEPKIIKKNFNIFKSILNKPGIKVTILTARSAGFPIKYFFKQTFNIEPYVVALGDSNPKKKANWIENHIKKGYEYIFFMDDSDDNLEEVEKLKKKYPNIKLDVVDAK